MKEAPVRSMGYGRMLRYSLDSVIPKFEP